MAKKDWENQVKADRMKSEKDRLRDEIIKLRKLLKELEEKWHKMLAAGE